jgi:serine/threonine-protein kinase HipA
MPSRTDALEIIYKIWGEVREWKTTFAEFGADDKLLNHLASAFRALEDIASPALDAEVRNAAQSALTRSLGTK